VKAGETANAIQLEKDLEAVKQLYGTRGYVAASVSVEEKPDDSRPTVQYLVRISEGDVYRMGDLKIHGLDSNATARLENDWTLRPGDVYDSSYPGRFVEQAYKEIGDWEYQRPPVCRRKGQNSGCRGPLRSEGHRPQGNGMASRGCKFHSASEF